MSGWHSYSDGHGEMTNPAPFGSLICDTYGTRCDCCGRLVRRTRRSLWHGPHAICFACFSVWYDGSPADSDEPITAADIKRFVLAAEEAGTFPFPAKPGDGHERVPE